jgi:hypothetical protein
MNLFILSLIPREIAEAMMDKHVSKILLEAVQMLCTSKRLLDPEESENDPVLYKQAHKNHPVTIWCRTSRANFVWTLDVIDAMHEEWKYRYGHPETKVHKSYTVAQHLRARIPANEKFPVDESRGITPFAQAMPDIYKNEDAVQAYRAYYMSPEKQRIATWKSPRSPPEWYKRQEHIMEFEGNVRS